LWQRYLEPENGPLAFLRLAVDLAIELLYDHLGYRQTEAHATTVDITSLCKAAEEPEELVEILLLDPQTCIFHLTSQ
jgi:hypothetical protein